MKEDVLLCKIGRPPGFSDACSSPLKNVGVFTPAGMAKQLVLDAAEIGACTTLWIDSGPQAEQIILPLGAGHFGVISKADLIEADFVELLRAAEGASVIAWHVEPSTETEFAHANP